MGAIDAEPPQYHACAPMLHPGWRSGVRFVRPLFWAIVCGFAVWLLYLSWMKWIDLYVDFGREVYLPWRVLSGEHIGRDFVHPYGPFSVYFNAGLFAVFGVSIRTLVVANLVVYAVIVVLLYLLLRRAFGFFAAAVATLFGIAVFGFGMHLAVANYTFAAPYSHEATHGMLWLLLLVLALDCSGRRGFAEGGLWTGVALGGVFLTKTEYVFTACLLLATTAVPPLTLPTLRPKWKAWGWRVLVGCMAVMAVVWLALASVIGPLTAAKAATGAILAPFYSESYTLSSHVLRFLGADHPFENLRGLLAWGGSAVGGLLVAAWAVRTSTGWVKAFVIGGSIVGALAAGRWIGWQQCGRVLPWVLLGGMGWMLQSYRRSATAVGPRRWSGLLLASAALGMMARMALAPKIYHYGFFQAMLAGVWVCAFLVGEWPRLMARTRVERIALGLVGFAFLGSVAWADVVHTRLVYSHRDVPVAEGADRVFSFGTDLTPLSKQWEETRKFIVAHSVPDSSVLVVPQGMMMNYWTRRKHPLRIMDLLPATLPMNGEDVVVSLARTPPSLVILLSPIDTSEYGFKTYGADAASGQPLVEWIGRNYHVVASAGGDPFAPGSYGIRIMQHN